MGKTMSFLSLLVLSLPTVVFASSPTAVCGAVELPYQIDGSYQGQRLGASVAGTGDVNGDGIPDFIVGAPNASQGDPPGKAFVYSGKDGTVLFELASPDTTSDWMGEQVAAAGDVNGDGKPDFICGAYAADPNGMENAGSVYVFSGADGTLLYHIMGTLERRSFGWALAGGKEIGRAHV